MAPRDALCRSCRPEVMGTLLLGVALFLLALSLRDLQPGLLPDLPAYAAPAGAGVLYVAAALALAGLRLRALLALVLMLAAHVLYAFLMGCAFSLASAAGGAAGTTVVDALLEGLTGHPPAVLLQVAFVVPLVAVLAAPWLPRAGTCEAASFPAVEQARSQQELLQSILSVEHSDPAVAPDALHVLARRARELLTASPAAGQDAPPAEEEQAPGLAWNAPFQVCLPPGPEPTEDTQEAAAAPAEPGPQTEKATSEQERVEG